MVTGVLASNLVSPRRAVGDQRPRPWERVPEVALDQLGGAPGRVEPVKVLRDVALVRDMADQVDPAGFEGDGNVLIGSALKHALGAGREGEQVHLVGVGGPGVGGVDHPVAARRQHRAADPDPRSRLRQVRGPAVVGAEEGRRQLRRLRDGAGVGDGSARHVDEGPVHTKPGRLTPPHRQPARGSCRRR